MLKTWIFVAVCFSTIAFGAPIKNGYDVGDMTIVQRKLVVTGQEKYPFIAHVVIETTRNGMLAIIKCAGVIIGKRAVLTAGHCLYGEVNPKITVHAGIVHLDMDKRAGQKITVLDYKVHGLYKEECQVKGTRCCFVAHDVAIMWLRRNFQWGPTVQKAAINFDGQKPVGKEGWILGWGLNSRNENPSMLQMGKVKVVSDEYCEQFNPDYRMPPKTICLKPVRKGTRSAGGDSGGPFVIDGVVYGISSFTLFDDEFCLNDSVEFYSYLPAYNDWISNQLRIGHTKGKI